MDVQLTIRTLESLRTDAPNDVLAVVAMRHLVVLVQLQVVPANGRLARLVHQARLEALFATDKVVHSIDGTARIRARHIDAMQHRRQSRAQCRLFRTLVGRLTLQLFDEQLQFGQKRLLKYALLLDFVALGVAQQLVTRSEHRTQASGALQLKLVQLLGDVLLGAIATLAEHRPQDLHLKVFVLQHIVDAARQLLGLVHAAPEQRCARHQERRVDLVGPFAHVFNVGAIDVQTSDHVEEQRRRIRVGEHEIEKDCGEDDVLRLEQQLHLPIGSVILVNRVLFVADLVVLHRDDGRLRGV